MIAYSTPTLMVDVEQAIIHAIMDDGMEYRRNDSMGDNMGDTIFKFSTPPPPPLHLLQIMCLYFFRNFKIKLSTNKIFSFFK